MKSGKGPDALPTKPTEPDEMFAFEMYLTTAIKIEWLDDFIANLKIGKEEREDLQEWRYLSERAYLEGHFDYAVALLKATTRASGYTCKYHAAIPHAKAKTAQLAASRRRAEHARDRKAKDGMSTQHNWEKVAKRVERLRAAGVSDREMASKIERLENVPACSGQSIPDNGLSFFSATAGGSPSLA